MPTLSLHPIAIVRAGVDRQIEQQVRRDLRRGLTTGSRAYQRAMQEAKALFEASEQQTTSVRPAGSRFPAHRADGRPFGMSSRFGQSSRRVA